MDGSARAFLRARLSRFGHRPALRRRV